MLLRAHEAIGVWPAAFVAGEMVLRFGAEQTSKGEPWKCLEVGCGAGFPSLVAAKLGAQVLAFDSEQLPLDLLQEAFLRQKSSSCLPALASLVVRRGDATAMEDDLFDSVDLVVVSDLLYSVELGEAVGRRLGTWLRDQEGTLILTDGGRSGRAAFLEAFQAAYGAEARFEKRPVPVWATQTSDFFDGAETQSVGVLRY
eukprot:s2961_g7.t1